MVSVPHVSMHPHPLLFYRRTLSSSVAALRMLSSSSSQPNPNPSTTKHISEIPFKSSNFPLSAPPGSTSQILALSKTFAISTKQVPIAVGEDIGETECPLVVVSFYKFADFPDHADLRKPLKELCERLVDSPIFFFYIFPLQICASIFIFMEYIKIWDFRFSNSFVHFICYNSVLICLSRFGKAVVGFVKQIALFGLCVSYS